nr:hypothetical protein [Devosia sediminis]
MVHENTSLSILSSPDISEPAFLREAYRLGKADGVEWLTRNEDILGRLGIACSAVELDGYAGGFLEAVWQARTSVPFACCWIESSVVDLGPDHVLAQVYQDYADPWPAEIDELLIVSLLVDTPAEISAMYRKVQSKLRGATVQVCCGAGPQAIEISSSALKARFTVNVRANVALDRGDERLGILRRRLNDLRQAALPELVPARIKFWRDVVHRKASKAAAARSNFSESSILPKQT